MKIKITYKKGGFDFIKLKSESWEFVATKKEATDFGNLTMCLSAIKRLDLISELSDMAYLNDDNEFSSISFIEDEYTPCTDKKIETYLAIKKGDNYFKCNSRFSTGYQNICKIFDLETANIVSKNFPGSKVVEIKIVEQDIHEH